MKIHLGLVALALPFSVSAADSFPGVQAVLSPDEFARAGLAQLRSDQIAVIDAAIARHYHESVKAEAVKIAAALPPPKSASGHWYDVIKPNFSSDWKTAPALKAKVVAWRGGNRFELDNGQLWEGLQPIPYDLPGAAIEIQPRPLGALVLIFDGHDTAVQLRRVR
jgi:hypothetical protein